MRTVILHYHLFKNAGTSVDQILKKNFPDGWATREFSGRGGSNTTQVRQWIKDTPHAVAFSSHTMVGPLSELDAMNIIPLVLLRDPIERIVSAYQFERQQRAQTKGAVLAKAHDLDGYVKARLAMKGDHQCQDFQTMRLATMVPGDGPILGRAMQACAAIQGSGVLGLVSQFDAAMMTLQGKIKKLYPDFQPLQVRANRGSNTTAKLSADLLQLLIRENANDLALLDHVRQELCAA